MLQNLNIIHKAARGGRSGVRVYKAGRPSSARLARLGSARLGAGLLLATKRVGLLLAKTFALTGGLEKRGTTAGNEKSGIRIDTPMRHTGCQIWDLHCFPRRLRISSSFIEFHFWCLSEKHTKMKTPKPGRIHGPKVGTATAPQGA